MVEINPQLRRYHSTGGRLTRIFRLRVAFIWREKHTHSRDTRRTRVYFALFRDKLGCHQDGSRRQDQIKRKRIKGAASSEHQKFVRLSI